MVLVKLELWRMYDLENKTAYFPICATNLTTGGGDMG